MARSQLHAVLILAAAGTLASAHPGGLDSSGGHFNRKTGEYHKHRSSYTPPPNPPAASASSSRTPSAPPDAKPKSPPPTRPRFKPFSDDDELGISQLSEPVRASEPKPAAKAQMGWADLDPVTNSIMPRGTGAESYADAHSLQLRAFHDSKGVLICIGEVAATHRDSATVITATGEERSIRLGQLSLADRAFVAAEHSRDTTDIADDLARQQGYRVWRTVTTGSTLKAKAIAYDGKSVTLKSKTPKVTVVPAIKLSIEDGAYLAKLQSLVKSSAASMPIADR